LAPQLSLSYNSSATDGASGLRPKQQAGWAGKGWSLDTGSLARTKLTLNATTATFYSYYTLVLNGQSFELRGTLKNGYTNTNDPDPTHWNWNPTDESFIRVEAISNGTSVAPTVAQGTIMTHTGELAYGRGGTDWNGNWRSRYAFRVWTKDGTRYDFAEDLWWGWDACDAAAELYIEPYKYLLSEPV
jgi:hypothetical protein